jgi:hypothetical protein
MLGLAILKRSGYRPGYLEGQNGKVIDLLSSNIGTIEHRVVGRGKLYTVIRGY